MRTNNMITKTKAGEKAYGCTLGFSSTTMIELIGMAGFDFVMFDCEHGSFSPDTLDDLCRVAEGNGLTPIARIATISSPSILSYLDRGVMGILESHITTKAEAQQLVDACFYGPQGSRSLGAPRGAYYGRYPSMSDYLQHSNSQIWPMALLEDVGVLDELDGILSVDGIDIFWPGPKDLAQSMGLPGQPDHPRVLEALTRMTDTVHAAGKYMADDVLVNVSAVDLFMGAATAHLGAAKAQNKRAS